MGKKVLVFKIFFLLCFLASGQSVLFDPFTKPEELTLKQLELKAFEIEKQSRLSHYLQGIYFLQKLRGSEEGYEKSWRAAHFTGVTVAMSVYRFLTHISQSNYDFMREHLKGLYLLSHVSGSQGVLARMSFPVSKVHQFGKLESTKNSMGVEKTPFYRSPDQLENPFDAASFEAQYFSTGAQASDLVGFAYGLSISYAFLKRYDKRWLKGQVDWLVLQIEHLITAVYQRVSKDGWVLKDHKGKKAKSSKVTGLLKLQMLKLYVSVLEKKGHSPELEKVQKSYEKLFQSEMKRSRRSWGRAYKKSRYYKWSLRNLEIHGLYELEDDLKKREQIAAFVQKNMWRHYKDHQNTFFNFISNVIGQHKEKKEESLLSLRRLYFKPLHNLPSPIFDDGYEKGEAVPVHLRAWDPYFLWQKDGFTVKESDDKTFYDGTRKNSGLSYTLVYWMARYYNFL